MSKLEFSMNLPSPPDKLIALITNYENYTKFFESQIKSINILETKNEETITEEVLTFSTIINHDITQKTLHKKIDSNKLYSKVLSGPFKDTILEVTFEKIDTGTKINVQLDLKLSIKYKILLPIIKKRYKTVIIGLMYKMNNIIQSNQQL